MPGDVVNIQAYAKYSTPSTTASNFTAFISSLLGAFNLAAPVAGEVGTPSAGINTFGNWEIGTTGDEKKGDPMKIFATIIMFDRNYNFLDVTYQPVSSSGALISASYTAKQPGYAYLYVSNEHPYLTDVYFDDVTVSLTPSPVVEITDYYSFGLVAQNFQRQAEVPQNFKYNGKEQINDLSIDWVDYGWRMYMPETGRWNGIDLVSELFFAISPYTYCVNNPVKYGDKNGLWPGKKAVDNGVVGERGFNPIPTVHPVNNTIKKKHNGQDLPASIGNKVHAIAKGVVQDVGFQLDTETKTGWGWYVEIKHSNGYVSRYAHLSQGEIKVVKGQEITEDGSVIALSGQSGGVTGPHLHLELILNGKFIDPIGIEDLQVLLDGLNGNKDENAGPNVPFADAPFWIGGNNLLETGFTGHASNLPTQVNWDWGGNWFSGGSSSNNGSSSNKKRQKKKPDADAEAKKRSG